MLSFQRLLGLRQQPSRGVFKDVRDPVILRGVGGAAAQKGNRALVVGRCGVIGVRQDVVDVVPGAGPQQFQESDDLRHVDAVVPDTLLDVVEPHQEFVHRAAVRRQAVILVKHLCAAVAKLVLRGVGGFAR